MSEPFERLRAARRHAGLAGPSDAARKFGWSVNTYKSHENGERGLRPRVAQRYARAFHVDPAWLLYNQGPPPFVMSGEPPEPDADALDLDEDLYSRASAVAKRVAEIIPDGAAIEAEIAALVYVLLWRQKNGTPITDDEWTIRRLERFVRRVLRYGR